MPPSVVLDESMRITACDKEFVSAILPERMALGCSVLCLFDHPDRESVREACRRCVSLPGEPSTISDRYINTVSDRPDGLPIRLRHDCVVTYSPESSRFDAVFRPTTSDVARAEADELKDFFNKAPIALHWLSDEGKVLWANDRELEVLGYTREEYIGSDIMDFCPDSREDVLEIFKELGSGNTIRDIPIRFRKKNGGVVDLLIDSNVNYKEDGSFNHTRCFIRDDTARKIREARDRVLLEEARRHSEDRARFVAKIMHEIKTPIHVLSMAANDEDVGDDVDDDVNDDVSDDDGRRVVRKQISLLSRLVSNVTTAMQFEDGYKPPTDLVECDVVSFFEGYPIPSLENNAVTATVDPGSGAHGSTLACEVDVRKLTTVVDELLFYCDSLEGCADLRLRLSPDPDAREYTVEVSCTGVALDVPSVHRVFHRYWLDSTSSDYRELKTDAPGLNLSLNIAFNLVECMGSDLVVESTAERTTFRFTLGAVARSAAPILLESGPGPGPGPGPVPPRHVQRHVLVVEDNKVCQKMLERALKKLGHTCQLADNGAVAVDAVTRRGSSSPLPLLYDMVFMDIRMPVMDGIEATTLIRRYLDENHLDLPIVALTAECNPDALREHGFVDVLEKPTSASGIKASIDAHARTLDARP